MLGRCKIGAGSTSEAGGVIDVQRELDGIRLDQPRRRLRGQVAHGSAMSKYSRGGRRFIAR
jgi:hypothetical protein